MPGPDNPDYDIRIAPADDTADSGPASATDTGDPDGSVSYSISFGSLIRAGRVYEHPSGVETRGGRTRMATTTLAGDETHRWRADGPLHLIITDGTASVTINDADPIRMPTGAAVDFSCPTERKRVTTLGAVTGGVLGVLTTVVADGR